MFLFIVGTGRNGSKLLRSMLSQHPKFGILMESHYLPMLINKFENKEISAKVFYDHALEYYGSNNQRWLYTIAVYGNCRVSKLKAYIASEIKTSKVQSVADSISSGSFNVFQGPIISNDGAVIASGASLNDGDLWAMNYYVQGVIGKIPN